MACLLCLDANEYAARGRIAPAQQKTRRGLPPGRPGVVSVNTLFWKILVTRVKQKMCDASVVSLSCCPNSGFARARHFRALRSFLPIWSLPGLTRQSILFAESPCEE